MAFWNLKSNFSVPLLCLQAHSLSHVQLFGHCNPIDHSLPGSFAHGIFPGKNTRVGYYFLLQGIFPTQGWNPVSPALAGGFFPLYHLDLAKLSSMSFVFILYAFSRVTQYNNNIDLENISSLDNCLFE